MRGGSSKGVFLLEKDLPKDPGLREQTLLAIFGSPDKRQIDGLGGADPLTSKVAIIGPPPLHLDADVSYTFGNVGIEKPYVTKKGNCGNITAGVGPFAIDEGLVEALEPLTTVRIFNTNTNQILTARVPVSRGRTIYQGDYSIAGVPGTGAKIEIDFSRAAGALTGKLVPTGNPQDTLSVPGLGKINVSIVDCAAVQVFIEAKSMNMSGTEAPLEIDNNKELLEHLEAIRGAAATLIGLSSSAERAATETPNSPHLVIVNSPRDYQSHLTNQSVLVHEIDILAKMIFVQKIHKTYAGTGAICTAVAAKIPGTIPNRLMIPLHEKNETVRIGHPGGVFPVEVCLEKRESNFLVKKAVVGRTARRIMEGYCYIKGWGENY